jgi:hypothetical protein
VLTWEGPTLRCVVGHGRLGDGGPRCLHCRHGEAVWRERRWGLGLGFGEPLSPLLAALVWYQVEAAC